MNTDRKMRVNTTYELQEVQDGEHLDQTTCVIALKGRGLPSRCTALVPRNVQDHVLEVEIIGQAIGKGQLLQILIQAQKHRGLKETGGEEDLLSASQAQPRD